MTIHYASLLYPITEFRPIHRTLMMNEGYFICEVIEFEYFTQLNRAFSKKALNVIHENNKNIEIYGFDHQHSIIFKIKS